MKKSIPELSFHEQVIIRNDFLFVICMRVYGGYIYISTDRDKTNSLISSVFVPACTISDRKKYPVYGKSLGESNE